VRPSWSSIEAIAGRMRASDPEQPTEAVESVPVRWYLLGGFGSGRPIGPPVMIYSHQLRSWEGAIEHLERISAADRVTLDATALADRLFAGCDAPLPPRAARERLVEHFRRGGGRPVSFGLEHHQARQPRALAQRILEDDLGEIARTALVNGHYDRLVEAIYPTCREYRAAVDGALYDLQHTAEAASNGRVDPVFELETSWAQRRGRRRASATLDPLDPGRHPARPPVRRHAPAANDVADRATAQAG
jgi:hypothetical protein